MNNLISRLKISKTAVKILLISLSAAFGAFVFSYFAYMNDIEAYEMIIKIGIRLIVIGLVVASTYDIISRSKK